MTQDELKKAAAHAALEYVGNGTVVGVGTGSTGIRGAEADSELRFSFGLRRIERGASR